MKKGGKRDWEETQNKNKNKKSDFRWLRTPRDLAEVSEPLTFPRTRFLPMYFQCQALALLSLRSKFYAHRFSFSVPRSLSTVRYHCCLIMLSVTFHMQLRLTTSQAVCKLASKRCQVVEHQNRSEEGKIIIFLRHEEVLSCETHRYLALELKKKIIIIN